MNQATTKVINFRDLLLLAKQETLAMSKQGMDISDPSIVTPLEATANQYPEIAPDCNQSLMELVKEQMNLVTQPSPPEIVNEF